MRLPGATPLKVKNHAVPLILSRFYLSSSIRQSRSRFFHRVPLAYWCVSQQQDLKSIIHNFLATYQSKDMEWLRRGIRRLLGRCIGAENEPGCIAIPVSQEVIPHHDRPTITMVEYTAAGNDDNLSCLPADDTVAKQCEDNHSGLLNTTVVDTIDCVQCCDSEFYTLTGTVSPSVFTGLVPVKQKMNFCHQSTPFHLPSLNYNEAVPVQLTEDLCETQTSVKTNDDVQHVSPSSNAICFLQRQTGDTPVSSLHEVSLPQRSLTNHGIKCPLSNVIIMSRRFDHNGGTITSEHGDLRITIPEDAIGIGD